MLTYDYANMNFSKPIDRSFLDIDMYNKKFQLADKAFSDPNTHPKVLQKLLNDRTLRIYFKFKIAGKPLKLFPYQDLIGNDPHRFIIFRAANQIGKSEQLDDQAADNLTLDHGFGHNEAICSASLKQATYQMIRVKDRLRSAGLFDWSEEKGEIDNMSMISFDIRDENKPVDPKTGKRPIKYTNRLIVTPAGEGILGFDLHVVNLDEFEFWKDVDLKYFLNQLAEPRTYATKGKIKIYSNPNGQQSYVAELEELRLPNGTKKYHTYVFNFLDRPGNTEDELELAKLGKTRSEIESTLLAIRTTSDKNYFTPDEIDRSRDETMTELKMVNEQPFFFMDVGAKHDQSVLVGGYVSLDEKHLDAAGNPFKHFNICIIHCYPVSYPLSRVIAGKGDDGDGWHYEKSVKDYIDEWSKNGIIPILGVDVTGNSGISPLMTEHGLNPIDVTFSGPSKSGMYQRFKYLMEKGFLHRIPSKEFDYQASHMEMKKSARGYLMIHHESEKDLDDVMDSCFTGDTLILTNKGQIPIKNIIVGDMVMTRKGFRPVKKVMIRKAKVLSKFGTTATPNHPYITPEGIVKFKKVDESTKLYKWNEKKKSIEEGYFTDIQNQNTDISDNIIGLMPVANLQNPCTELYMRTRSEKYQRDLSYIIKILTPSIIISRTLNVFLKMFICPITCLLKKGKNGLLKMSSKMRCLKQKNGTEVKTGKIGIKNMLKKLFFLKKKKKENVCVVKKNLQQGAEQKNIVQKYVAKEKEQVYNLHVFEEEEYFANNILVHNCAGFIYLADNPDLVESTMEEF